MKIERQEAEFFKALIGPELDTKAIMNILLGTSAVHKGRVDLLHRLVGGGWNSLRHILNIGLLRSACSRRMSALGQDRSFSHGHSNVCFAPKAVIRCCQSRDPSPNENGGTLAAVSSSIGCG
jgi:hypothetical protein